MSLCMYELNHMHVLYIYVYPYPYPLTMIHGAPLGREFFFKAPTTICICLRQMQSQNLSKSIEGLSEKDAQKILGNGQTVRIPVAVPTVDDSQIAMLRCMKGKNNYSTHEGNELLLDTVLDNRIGLPSTTVVWLIWLVQFCLFSLVIRSYFKQKRVSRFQASLIKNQEKEQKKSAPTSSMFFLFLFFDEQ